MKHPVYHRLVQMAIVLLLLGAAVRQIDGAEAQGPFFYAEMNKSFSPISISAGGISTLTITIFNANDFPLSLSTPAWTDSLPPGLFVANPANTTTTCGGIVSAVGGSVSLSGGTVPAQVGSNPGSCSVTVHVSSITAGNLKNTILAGSLAATDANDSSIPVTNSTDASATLTVNRVQPPTLSKTFAPNTIWVGQTSTLTITIWNNDPNSDLTQVSITDALPANVYVAAAPATPQCGGGTVTGVVGSGSVSFSGGSIPKSSHCDLIATVTSITPGTYTDTIPANAIQTQQGVSNTASAAAPLNVQSVGIQKAFSPVEFQQGGTSTVTITLQNPSTSDYTNASFVDNLPAGVTVDSSPASPQCSGAITSTASSVSLNGGIIPKGTIAAPGTCTIVFTVTSSIPATYTNTIPPGALTTQEGATNVLAATANLTVYATGLGVGGGKSFNPAVIPVGGVSRLAIAITAPADTDLTNFTLSDALPLYVQVAATPNPSTNNCGSLVFAPAAGDTLLSAAGGTIPAGTTCTLAVNVTSGTPNQPGGTYTNIVSPANISDNEHRDLPGNLTGNLTVSGLSVSKAFYPPAVSANGISTLTISLTNANIVQLDNVSLTDTLPGNTTNGVVIAPTPNASTTCPSGHVTANAGSQSISLSGAVIPAQIGSVPGLCTIIVDVVGKGTSTTYTNFIDVGKVSGTLHGTSLVVYNPAAASANLSIAVLQIGVNKGFSPVSVFGGSASTLTVLLTNPNNSDLAGIYFTDNLAQGTGGGMMIANPPNFSDGNCSGSLSGTPGSKSFSFNGGSLAANASCTMTLSVTMNVNANLTNSIGAGAVKSTNGASNPQATSASLTNLPGASVTKVFLTNPILSGAGNSDTLNITIQNTGNFLLDGMGLIDSLPTGMDVVDPTTSPQCLGTITTVHASGTTPASVTLANGVLPASSSCTIAVTVTAPVAGNYQNCIGVGALTDNQGATNHAAACDTLAVNPAPQPPSMTKTFAPNPIAAGGTSVLTFTITNPPANSVPLTGVGFSDPFLGGLTVASVPNPAQCGGAITSTSTSITLTGGTIAANGSCMVSVLVTAGIGGSYPNTSGNVTSTNGGTGNTASDTLDVLAPPAISKVFNPAQINAGNPSTLTFTITNSNPSDALTGIAFTDALPGGVQVAASPHASNSGCDASSTPVFYPAAGDTTLSFSSGSIEVGGTCTVNVDVTAANGGNYTNTSGPVTSNNGGTGNTASSTLVVTGVGLSLVKSTSTVDYQKAGDQIQYSYLLKNTGTGALYAPFQVSDDHIGSPSLGTPFTCGSASSLDPGGTVSCTATYTVAASDVSAGSVTNTATATAMDAMTGGHTVTSNPSSVTVNLAALSLTKTTTTTGYHVVGDTITYTYTLTNTGGVTLFSPFKISDDHIGSPLGSPFACGSATSLPPLANLTCSAIYTVQSGDLTAGSVTNHATATAKDTAGSTVTSTPPSSVTVYKVLAPSISKAFSPTTIAGGGTSTLTFQITNPSGNEVPLTGVGFSDTFPSGVVVAAAPDPSQCGGTVSSGADWIALAGGAIVPNSFCMVTVSVTGTSGGVKINTSGAVSSTNGGTGNTASATLTVIAPPTISKTFNPSSILENGTSTITFTLTNPAGNTVALDGVSFSDDLPANVTVTAAASPQCGGGTVTSTATTITLNNGSIPIDGTCTVTVDVTSSSAGTYNNTTNPISSTNGGTGAPSNTATLSVNSSADLSIIKDDGVQVVHRGSILTYTIDVGNAGPSDANGAVVQDLLPASLTSATWTCTPSSGASCSPSGSGNINDVVNIPINGTLTYTLTATVANTANSDIINNATVNPPAGITDTNLSNNSASDIDQLDLLSITKTASPTFYLNAGDTITYSYTVTNTGTSILYAPFAVVDTKLPGLDCSSTAPSNLNPGQSFPCTGTYTVQSVDITNTFITNQAHATAQDSTGYPVTSNTATQTVNLKTTMTVAKTAGVPSVTAAGEVVGYSYRVTNTGGAVLLNIQVSDNNIDAGSMSCPATSLNTGVYMICTAWHTVTQAEMDAGGNLINTVTVTSSNADQQTATVIIPIIQQPTLGLQKTITSGNPYSNVGTVIAYQYVLTNTGNVTLSGASGVGSQFTVTDDQINGNSPFNCGTATTLAPQETTTCTATYIVTQGDLDSGSVTNTASGHGMFNTQVDSNTDSQTAKANQTSSLALTKTITSGTPYSTVGTVLQYSYVIKNSGNVTITGSGPGNVFLVTDDHIGSPLGTPFTCGIATSLGQNATTTCTGSYTITQADLDNGSVTNHASTDAYWVSKHLTASASRTASAIQTISLTLVKSITSGSTYTNVGDMIDYSYLLTNAGNVDLVGSGGPGTAFTITDDYIGTFSCGLATSLAPGAQVSCIATYTITQADIDNTAVVNHANGHGKFHAANVTSNQGSQTSTGPTPNPILTLQKTVDHIVTSFPGGTEFNQAGDTVVYDYLLKNMGNVTLLGTGSGGRFTITDSRMGTVSCPSGTTSLAPLASLTCTASYTVQQSDVDAGSITNTATGNASYHAGAVTSNPSSQTVQGSQTPALSLTKAITAGDPYQQKNDPVTYQYTLTNTGNVTLTGPGGGPFTITDDHINGNLPFTCNNATTLDPGAGVVCTQTYLVTQGDVDHGTVTNTASGHGFFGLTSVDTSPHSQTATAIWVSSITLTKAGVLDMTVVPPGTVANPGDQIDYTFTVQNTGLVTLYNITLTDPLITIKGGPIPSLAPGASDSATFTGTYALTQLDIDAGSVGNTATVASNLPSGAAGPQNTTSTTVTIPQVASLLLVKTITSGDPYSVVGGTISYLYTLTNSGNVTLNGATGAGSQFTVTDDHINGNFPFTCNPATILAPNTSLTCTAAYAVTSSDLNQPQITNTATAAASFNTNSVQSNSASQTAHIAPGSIVGIVFDDVNLDKLQDNGEHGLGGVTVRIYDSTGTTQVATTTTATDGSFSVSNLLPRNYLVEEQDLLGYASTTPNTVSVTVPPAGTATADFGDVQIPGRSNNEITGIVFDDTNQDGVFNGTDTFLQSVTVTLYDHNNNVVATTATDSQGRYAFTNLPPGSYTVVETNPINYISTTLDHVGVVLSSGIHAVVDFGDYLPNLPATVIDPAVTKFGSPSTAHIGDMVIFTITVGNNGNTDANDVQLTDTMPPFVDLISVTISPNVSFTLTGNTLNVDFGTVTPIDFYTVTLVTRVNNLGQPPGGDNNVSITTTSAGDPLFNDAASARITIPANTVLPVTGFAPGTVTSLAAEPQGLYDTSNNLILEIPTLGINATIVGVPQSGDSWDVSWLGDQIGYLEGTAFPTWSGNSVLTGHVYGADGLPGPFVDLNTLSWGDLVIIHFAGQRYIYEVRSNQIISPTDTSIFSHKDNPWLTLLTCKDYNAQTHSYAHRVAVGAVLVQIESDPPPGSPSSAHPGPGR